MESRVQKALQNRQKGYTCSQAVICAYSDLFGMDEKQTFMISEGFGGGMGGLQLTCGAVTALFMLIGLKNSTGNLNSPDSKTATYKLVKEAAQTFEQKNGSINCAELKGVKTGKMLRSCEGCIEDACLIFENYIKANEKVLSNVADTNLA